MIDRLLLLALLISVFAWLLLSIEQAIIDIRSYLNRGSHAHDPHHHRPPVR